MARPESDVEPVLPIRLRSPVGKTGAGRKSEVSFIESIGPLFSVGLGVSSIARTVPSASSVLRLPIIAPFEPKSGVKAVQYATKT
jgi:hypothetical protein